jgi:hypothetical protein
MAGSHSTIARVTGERVELGHEVTTFRGDTYKLIGLCPPHLRLLWGGGEVEYYPGTIGAKFIREED